MDNNKKGILWNFNYSHIFNQYNICFCEKNGQTVYSSKDQVNNNNNNNFILFSCDVTASEWGTGNAEQWGDVYCIGLIHRVDQLYSSLWPVVSLFEGTIFFYLADFQMKHKHKVPYFNVLLLSFIWFVVFMNPMREKEKELMKLSVVEITSQCLKFSE